MSEQFESWNGEDATELYGIGKYGSMSIDCSIRMRYQRMWVI